MLTAPQASNIVERVKQSKYGHVLAKIGEQITGEALMGRTSVRIKLDMTSGRFWVREKLHLLGYKISTTETLETEIRW